MTNEMTNYQNNQENIVEETENYKVIKLEDGTFLKKMKYQKIWTAVPETEEDQIKMYQVLNSNEEDELVTPLKNMLKQEIIIKNYFTNPYQSFDKATGESTDAVTTIIEDIEGHFYATSSKTVYYDLLRLAETFNTPNTPDYRPIIVKVNGTRQQKGIQISLSFVGFQK